MTVAAIRMRRLAAGRLALVIGAVLLVLIGFGTGILPANRWQPFLLLSTWTFLGQGLLVTLTIGGISLVASLLIGIPLGMARSSLRGLVGWLVRGWIELVRATPILAILIIVFLGLPRLGVDLEAVQAAILGLTLYNSAVLAEVVRAGIQSISRGEVDAARSLGLGFGLTMRLVILPQALARMAPAIVSQLITLIKDTSLLFILGGQELVGFGRSFFNFYGNLLETFIVLAIIYFAICYPLSRAARRLEARQPVSVRIVVTGDADQIATATSVH